MICTSIWRFRAWKRASRGTNQRMAKVGGNLMRSLLSIERASHLSCLRFDQVEGRAQSGGIGRAFGRRLDAVAQAQAQPHAEPASSWVTWRLTAPWVTESSCAARVRLPFRAVASKARSAFRGGRRSRHLL